METEQQPEPSFVEEKRSEDPVFPEVSQDKYYDANTSSLAELFGNKKQVRGTMVIKSILCPGGGKSRRASPYTWRIKSEPFLIPDPLLEQEIARDVPPKIQGLWRFATASVVHVLPTNNCYYNQPL